MAASYNFSESTGRLEASAAVISLKAHPAALLFPKMSEDELSNLSEDIKKNGLLESIVLYHGQVLDGLNRLAACQKAGIEPHFVEIDGDLPSPTIYVLSKNLHRRHLSISQRAAIAADALPLFREEAKKRQGRRTDLETLTPIGVEVVGRSNKIAAEALNVGERTVCRAAAVKKDNPEAFERIKRGEITVNEASGDPEKQNTLRKAKADADAAKPYEAKTDYQKKVADTQKERMVRALSTVTGICRGLEEMDVRKALSACDDEERNTWIERAKELASQLRAFSSRLQKGF